MKRQKILIPLICILVTSCATLRLETTDKSIKKNEIEIKVEHNPEFIEFTAFKITIRNTQSKPVYFNPYDCRIESTLNGKTSSFTPLIYRKVIKKEEWEVEHLPSYQKEKEKKWIDIPAPPDYYFGDVPLYYYEMDKIKSLLFEEGYIIPGEEKNGYLFFPLFKERERLTLILPIEDVTFNFTYEVKSERKGKIEQILEELFSLNE